MATDQIDEQAAAYNAKVHDLTFEVGVTGAKALGQARFPLLKLPIVSQLFDLALRWQAGLFYLAFAKMGTFKIMDAQTAEEQIAFERAQMKLQAVIAVGTPADEFEAEEEWKAATLRIIKFDGVAPIR